MEKLTHIDSKGNARMVDVSDKEITERIAVAAGHVSMKPDTLKMILQGSHKKGDVLTVARVAGIQAAKQCAALIPMCHPLMLTNIDVELKTDEDENCVHIRTTCKLQGRTGVEMEALTDASVAALTIYDMCKAVDRDMVIENIRLVEKIGGKSRHFVTEEA